MRVLLDYAINNSLTIAIFLVGLSATYYFYRKSLRIKIPTYMIRSNNLISDFRSRFQELVVTYRNRPVEAITATKIAFWNEGKETIDGADIASRDPIRVSASDGYAVLECSILVQNNAANRWACSLENGVVELSFDFLDYRNGAVIQIVHSGKSSDDLSVSGTIKGAKTLRKRTRAGFFSRAIRRVVQPVSSFNASRWARTIAGCTTIALSAAMLAFAAMLLLGVWPSADPSSLQSWWYGMGIASIFASIGYFLMGLEVMSRSVPRGLEIFEE